MSEYADQPEMHADHETPWAMQLALRVDKANPAGHIETCEAAARAVVKLLADPRTTCPEGEWREAVEFWRDGRIRKLVRRAKGPTRWAEAQTLPGVTVEQGNAAVRAFLPGPVRPLPPELNKLQVSGTELPADEPSRVEDAMVLIGISPLITMTTGKACAQCGHAAQLALEAMSGTERAAWAADDFRVRVAVIDEDRWLAGPGDVHVIDAGFTELDGPTETTRAWW